MPHLPRYHPCNSAGRLHSLCSCAQSSCSMTTDADFGKSQPEDLRIELPSQRRDLSRRVQATLGPFQSVRKTGQSAATDRMKTLMALMTHLPDLLWTPTCRHKHAGGVPRGLPENFMLLCVQLAVSMYRLRRNMSAPCCSKRLLGCLVYRGDTSTSLTRQAAGKHQLQLGGCFPNISCTRVPETEKVPSMCDKPGGLFRQGGCLRFL